MSDEERRSNLEGAFPGRRCAPGGVIRRVVATLLDMVVFCALSAALALPMLREAPRPEGVSAFEVMASAAGDVSWVSHASGTIGLVFALWWCYFLVGWGLIGGTPGKLALGLRVVDYRGRCPIGASRAALRLVAYVASSVTIVVGHSMVFFRRDRRALHDILAGTRVVRWRRRDLEAEDLAETRVESGSVAETAETESETVAETEAGKEGETAAATKSESETRKVTGAEARGNAAQTPNEP